MLKSYKLAITTLFILILIGLFIRSYNTLWGPSIIPLSGDDFYHIFLWSGIEGLREDFNNKSLFRPLTEVFMFSYDDGHPPLRNIVLNIVLRFTKDLNSVRLISLIPGLIMIPLSFFLATTIDQNKNKKNGVLVGLLFAFLLTFLQVFIQLSFETRPYMMSSIFSFISIFVTLKFSRTLSKNSLVIFCISSCLALLSNYTSISIILICCLSILILAIRNYNALSPTLKILILIALSLNASLTIFQAYYVEKQGSLHRYTGKSVSQKANDYVASYYIKDIKDIPQRLIHYFHFFCSSKNKQINNVASVALFLAYIWGLTVLFKKKSYLLLSICIFPFVFGILAALGSLYPLGPNRHCSYLLPSVLISWAALLLHIIEKMSYGLKFLTIITIAILLIFILNPNLEKDYVWSIGGSYGYHQIPESNSNKLFNKLDEFKRSNKLIIFDEFSHELVKQKMIISWLKSELSGQNLGFPESILNNDKHRNFFYCSDKSINTGNGSCKENLLDLEDKLKTNNKSIVVISRDNVGLTGIHERIIQVIRDKSKYGDTVNHLDDFKDDWIITELGL
jgi:hypothetical protein